MSARNRKVLLVSAKWPLPSASTDGGDITLSEVISDLDGAFDLHLMVFRDDVSEDALLPGVEKIIVVRQEFANFKAYSRHDEEKFFARVEQSSFVADKIARAAASYDCIVILHTRFLLGLSSRPDVLSRCVLFPMFTGFDYMRSGERVPSEYIRRECLALPLVAGLVTPSECECETLVREYRVPRRVISVVPRRVERPFTRRDRCQPGIVNMVYVASVRLQKDHLSAVRLVKLLSDRDIEARLHCVGAIQDATLHEECCEFARGNGIANRVLFEGNKSSREVFDIVSRCAFNVSTSRCETFGRGVREGMAMGVPTIVLQSLASLFDCEDERIRPVIAADVTEMAETIIRLTQHPEEYARESAKGLLMMRDGGPDVTAEMIREKVSGVCNAASGEIVLASEDVLVGQSTDEQMTRARRLFVRRQFSALNELLDMDPKQDLAAKMNWALSCHLVGRHEEARRAYASLPAALPVRTNWLAFCHRDFCCADMEGLVSINVDHRGLSALMAHNLRSCRIAGGLEESDAATVVPVPVLAEHLFNDVAVRMGRDTAVGEDLRLQSDFIRRSVVVAQRRFSHVRRRVGFFLTDLQRHQDSAQLFEMVELLSPSCDVYVYFSNAFENKLVSQVAEASLVKNVSACSLEGVGNQIFDDEIEVLVDMTGGGLRNSNVALAWLEERLDLYKVLKEFPVLLSSPRYFGERRNAPVHGDVVVLGDARCISDRELLCIGELAERGQRVVYASCSFNEPMFVESFKLRLRRAGLRDGCFDLRSCIRPFSSYLRYLSGGALTVVATGASFVELAEAVFCGRSVVVTSESPALRRMARTHGVVVLGKGVPAPSVEIRSPSVESPEDVALRFVRMIADSASMLLTRVEDRNTRMAFRAGDELFCFHETCNGDAIVFANGGRR